MTTDCPQNAAIAYDFFVGKGLRNFQAAAVVGNLLWESNLDPQIPPGDSGTAHGIAQWHEPRWGNLFVFAAQLGRDPIDLYTQLEFVWYELQTLPQFGLSQLLAATSLPDAVRVFQNRFEICGDCHEPQRINLAESALECNSMRLPISKKGGGVVAASLGILTLVAAAGYGAYKALRVWGAS
jgi:hypothetical protein